MSCNPCKASNYTTHLRCFTLGRWLCHPRYSSLWYTSGCLLPTLVHSPAGVLTAPSRWTHPTGRLLVLGRGRLKQHAGLRTPKPLLSVASEATPPSTDLAAEGVPASEIVEGQPPLTSTTWRLRSRIESARDALVELRVHASTPALSSQSLPSTSMSPSSQKSKRRCGPRSTS